MRPVFDAVNRASRLGIADAARVYAAMGVPIFPCVPGEKRPLTRHGFHDATTNPEQITEWWSRWPDANIGVPTGPASGVEVVDVDVHRAGSGFVAFERAHREGLIDGWGVLVRTPSGGLHAYFPADASREQGSWQVPGSHVDFRGTGGYIIAPPSGVAIGDDRVGNYELIATSNDNPAPVDAGRLRNFFDPRPAPAMRPVAHVRKVSAERLAVWVAGLREGERNQGLFWAACRLAESGTPPGETCAALIPAAESVGLTPREASVAIRSAYRTTDSSPRTPPKGSDEAPRRSPRHTAGRALS